MPHAIFQFTTSQVKATAPLGVGGTTSARRWPGERGERPPVAAAKAMGTNGTHFRATAKSSTLIGFSIINDPFGVSHLWKPLFIGTCQTYVNVPEVRINSVSMDLFGIS